MILGIDMDGVVTDFAGRVAAEGWSMERGAPNHYYPHVNASPTFWKTLDPIIEDISATFDRLRHVEEVYFITRRFGVFPQRQTVVWLGIHGAYEANVIIAQSDRAKGRIAAALSLDAMVDDQIDVLTEVHRQTAGSTKGFLVTQPHNADVYLREGGTRRRVSGLDEALDLLDVPPYNPTL